MHKIVLGKDQAELNLRLPTHIAIRAVVDRSLRLVTPCGCEKPWSLVEVDDSWQDGKLKFAEVEACCYHRAARVYEALPGYKKPVAHV